MNVNITACHCHDDDCGNAAAASLHLTATLRGKCQVLMQVILYVFRIHFSLQFLCSVKAKESEVVSTLCIHK